jgi:hypothetical protein
MHLNLLSKQFINKTLKAFRMHLDVGIEHFYGLYKISYSPISLVLTKVLSSLFLPWLSQVGLLDLLTFTHASLSTLLPLPRTISFHPEDGGSIFLRNVGNVTWKPKIYTDNSVCRLWKLPGSKCSAPHCHPKMNTCLHLFHPQGRTNGLAAVTAEWELPPRIR